jgi:glucosamine-phosphate N-acetyltransferase
MHLAGGTTAVLVAVAAMVAWRIRRTYLQRHATQDATSCTPRSASARDHAALCRLAQVQDVGEAHFGKQLNKLGEEGMQRLLVQPDGESRLQVAASLQIEPKCLRGGAAAAHMSVLLATPSAKDCVTLIDAVVEMARREGCYKILTNALPAHVPLLRAHGFVRKQLTMRCKLQTPVLPGPGSNPLHAVALGAEGTLLSSYVLRPLEVSDGSAAYVSLLAQLSHAPPISDARFRAIIHSMDASEGRHIVYVVEDPQRAPTTPTTLDELGRSRAALDPGSLVACATLLLHRAALVPRERAHLTALIEDVVVDQRSRGTGLGRALVLQLLAVARERGCDDVLLNCSDENAPFYEKCGFSVAADGRECYTRYTT